MYFLMIDKIFTQNMEFKIIFIFKVQAHKKCISKMVCLFSTLI